MTSSPGPSPSSSTQLSEAKRALLEKRLRRRAPDPAFTIPRREPGREAPLSYGQERLWFMDRFAPGTAAYTIPMTLRLRGRLDVAALERAVGAVIARHESLRTLFPSDEDGRPSAVVQDRVEVPLERARAGDLGEALRLVSDAAAAPFDLSRGPLLRVLLVRVDDAPGAGDAEDAPDVRDAGEHVLLVALHHICGDGWSADILAEELGACYAGTEPPAPALQYGDYALWQRERPASEASLSYWRSRLAGVAPLELPLDGRRRGEQTFAGASRGFSLSPGLTERLTRLARESDATLYMVLLAAYQVLLGRYARQEDFAVGSPVGGRPRRELESVIGMFVNVLAMRADLSGDPSFSELLARVRRTTLEAYEHQELPFEQLVGELGVERDVSRSPVFQTVFALQSYGSRQPARWPGLEVEPFEFEARATRFDLELFLTEQPDGMGGLFVYNRDLFDAATVEGMVAQLRTLLEAVVAAPGTRISELDLLPGGERERVLACAAGPGEPYRDGATLGGMFEAQVARTPGAVAVEFEGERLTYAELETRANRLAHRLRGLGVGRGSLVAVCAERSVELVVALLGVVKAGGAYVPLDPDYPPERLAFMLADAAVPVLLAQRAVLETLPELRDAATGAAAPGGTGTAPDVSPTGAGAGPGVVTVVLDEPLDGPGTPVEPSATSADAAYMIYTSGSTGRPKGVPNSHAGIRNRLGWMQETYRLTGDDVVLQKTPAGFDVSVWEFFWPLVTGARLVLARPGGHRDAAYLRDLIVHRKVTTTHFVPSMLAAFLEEEGVEACGSLRRVVCSGEELPAHVAGRFFDRLPGTELYNLYGPTEAAIDVSLWRCRPGGNDGNDGNKVPIGHPVRNTSLYVLDGHLRPVPFGVPGELHIGGVQVAMGYHARPGLTAERFVPDPFGEPGARLYRTGDLARLRRDGAIDFLGRIDHQVKIRGQRIEPGEIEAALRALPGVREAVVTVREDGAPGDRRLVAYVVPAPAGATGTTGTTGGTAGGAANGTAGTAGGATGGTADGAVTAGTAADATDAAELRRALKLTLPEHMVPAAFVVLDALPLSPNGKLDRAALPAPGRPAETAAGPGSEPRTPVERAIADIWRELLGVESVGADGDFFALGGHSLVAIQAVARMRKALPTVGGRAVGVMDLFKHPTVRELAALVERPAGPSGPRSLLYELTAPGPRLMTYVCVPYGGGSPLIFQPLADALPDGCALHALAFPGHDPGLPDEETRPFEEVADLCVQEILSQVEGPLALYGHCGIGGALVVEVARRLEARGRALEAVYIGAIFPFARPRGRIAGPLARLTRYDRLRGDRVYENRMKSMGTDISGLDDEQIRFMVRNQRRDTLIAEEIFTRALAEKVERLRAPVISVVGEQDPTTDYYLERYREWHFLSDTAALVILDEAGHYFLKYRAAELSEILTNTHIAIGYGAADTLDRPSRGPGAGWWVEEVSVRSPEPEEAGPAPVTTTTATTGTATGTGAPAPAGGAPPPMSTPARTPVTATRAAPAGTAPARPARKAPPPSLRRFLIVAGFQLVSMVGTAITDFAIPVWIYLTTGSLVDFALFVALSIMPGVLIAPLAGAVVDRSSRRAMMILGNCMAGGTQLVLGALFWTGALEIWHIYPLTACLSIALIFQRLGFTTALPQLVPKEYMGHAAGVVQMVIGTAQFAAPLLAVALLSSIGLGGILVVDVASFALVLAALLVIRFPDTMAHSPREPLSKEIRQGLRMSIGNRHLRAAMIYFATLNVMLAALLLSITPLVLSFSTLTVAGQISFVGGLGGALGGMVIALWGGPRRRRMRGVLLATLALSVFAVITGLHPSALVVGIGAFGLWGCLSIVNGTFLTIIHTKVPQRFHGRVQSLNQMVSWSTLPIGMAVVAPLGERLLNPLLMPEGALASTVGAVIGVGPGRGVALMYIVLGLGIAVHVLISMRTRVLSTFDDEMPDAPPDDLVGAEILRERVGNRVSVSWTAPAFAKAITMPLPPERARALLRGPCPDVEVRGVRLRTGGEISAVYEVACADRDLIVKIYPNVLAARLHKEVRVYELLRGSGAACPEVVHWDDSRRELPYPYSVMTKVAGRPLSEVSSGLSREELAPLYREMGRTLRAIHAVRVEGFGPVEGPTEPTNDAWFGARMETLLAQFVDFGGDAELHAELTGRIGRDRHLLARCTAPVLCHYDFHERNVMVERGTGPVGSVGLNGASGSNGSSRPNRSNGSNKADHLNGSSGADGPLRMTGVIDMENAQGGDPLMDLARTDYFAVRGDEELRRHLLEGYGDLPDDWAERLAFYRLCHALEQWHWLATLGETAALPTIAEQLRECLKERV